MVKPFVISWSGPNSRPIRWDHGNRGDRAEELRQLPPIQERLNRYASRYLSSTNPLGNDWLPSKIRFVRSE